MREAVFVQIKSLLLNRIRDIKRVSPTGHVNYQGRSMRVSVPRGYNHHYSGLVKIVAENVDGVNINNAVAQLKKQGKLFAEHALSEGLSIEEATGGITVLKHAIWELVEKDGLLNQFSTREYHRFCKNVALLIDTISSQIAVSYHEHYKTAEGEQQRLAAIVSSSENAIISKDLNGTILSWNRTAEKLFGYKSGEAVGKHVSIFIPPDKMVEERENVNKIKQGKHVNHYETVRMHKNGKKIAVSLIASPVKNSRGEVVGVSAITRDITRQKTIDDKLRENQMLLDAFFNNTPAGLVIYDENNRYVRINSYAAKLYGMSASKILGKSVRDVLPEELADITAERNSSVINSKQSHQSGVYSALLPLHSNNTRKTSWQGVRFPVPLAQGKTGVGVVSIDITREVEARERMRESEEKFARAFSSNPAAIAITTVGDGIFQLVNDTWVKLMGYRQDEVIGKSARRLPIWPTPEAAQRFVNELREKGAVRGWIQEFRKKSGETFVSQLSAQAMTLHGERVVISTLVDITERQKTEEALRRSEERLRQLFDANLVGIIFWNFDGTITEANDVFLKTVGYTRKDLTAGVINWRKMTPTEYEHINEATVNELNRTGYHSPTEKEYIRKNGSRVHVLVGSTYTDNRKREGIGFVLDITDRKKLERLKDEFLGVASHELKTPVTSIKAYTQVLELMFRRKGEGQSVELLEKLERQVDKLSSLIADLLDITKIEAGKLVFREDYFDLNGLLHEVADEIQITAPRHLIIPKLDRTVTMYGDRERIGQVAINLLTNAVKYSPKAGSVILFSELNGKSITVGVRDHGVGIPADKKEKIFKRFYRIKGESEDTYPGLGLGLYISSEIVRRQGGAIWVESEPKKGSTFYFRLPIRKRSVINEEASP